MVKPNKDLLAEAMERNADRKRKFNSRILKGVLGVGAGIAIAMGLSGVSESEAKDNTGAPKNPTEKPIPPFVPEETKTIAPFENTSDEWEQTLKENADLSDRVLELQEQLEYKESKEFDFKKPERLKESDFPRYTITGDASDITVESRGIDAGDIPVENKGITTWQNQDEASVIKDYSQKDTSKQAQHDLAMQMMKHIKSNSGNSGGLG